MKFIQRLGYYLGGFSVGLIILAFFLTGKRTSCAYGPDARVLKNISTKAISYSDTYKLGLQKHKLDSLFLTHALKYSDVNFSESNTKTTPCKTYSLYDTYNEIDYNLRIKNCEKTATIESVMVKN